MDKKNPNKTFKRPIGDKKTAVLSKGHFSFEVSQEDVTQAVKVIKTCQKGILIMIFTGSVKKMRR